MRYKRTKPLSRQTPSNSMEILSIPKDICSFSALELKSLKKNNGFSTERAVK